MAYTYTQQNIVWPLKKEENYDTSSNTINSQGIMTSEINHAHKHRPNTVQFHLYKNLY